MNNTKNKKKNKGDLAKKRLMQKKVKKVTFGITDALTNTILYFIYVTVNLEGGRGPAGIHRSFNKADRLAEEFGAKQIRKALYNLKQRGFIKALKEEAALLEITETGMRRLKSKFPIYDEKRTWDKNLYIIVYDIPVVSNTKRDILRNALKKLKTVKLQDSVYLTPYNPREIIREITKDYEIEGQILISTLDPKNAFGTISNIKELLWDLYNLEDINYNYEVFIKKNKDKNPKEIIYKKQRLQIAFTYLAILKNDPQLPFDLLPDSYLGDEAYLLFKKLVRPN
jgi:DNA-binding transcriptional regulator PaaX